MEIVYILSSDLSRREKRPYGGGCVELLLVDDALYLLHLEDFLIQEEDLIVKIRK